MTANTEIHSLLQALVKVGAEGSPGPIMIAEAERLLDVAPVVGLRSVLEEARDLLLETRQGSPARSAGHNARLAVERALTMLDAPASSVGDDAVERAVLAFRNENDKYSDADGILYRLPTLMRAAIAEFLDAGGPVMVERIKDALTSQSEHSETCPFAMYGPPAACGCAAHPALDTAARVGDDAPVWCEGCGRDWADPPSKLCPVCQAFKEHQS